MNLTTLTAAWQKQKPEKLASGLLFLCQGQVLLAKRAKGDYKDTWGTPGGLQPLDEHGLPQHPWQSAKREVVEELGSLPPGVHKAVKTWTHKNLETGVVFTTFVVELPPNARALWEPELNEEHSEWRWVGPKDLKGLQLHPALARLISSFRDDIWNTHKGEPLKLGFAQGKASTTQPQSLGRLTLLVVAGLVEEAKRNLELAGLFDADSDYGGMLGKAVLDLVKTFAGQGHSGFSAKSTMKLFDSVVNRRPLTQAFWDEQHQELLGFLEKNDPENRCDRKVFFDLALGPRPGGGA